MKLTIETHINEASGKKGYFVLLDGRSLDYFSTLDEALLFFDNYKPVDTTPEILATREVLK